MTSKKGAIEDTKKSHKYSQTRSRKRSFEVTRFLIFRGEGVRGDLAQAVEGGRRSSAGRPGVRHPQHFVKIEVFSKDVLNFSRSSKIEVNHCYQIELKALSDTRV